MVSDSNNPTTYNMSLVVKSGFLGSRITTFSEYVKVKLADLNTSSGQTVGFYMLNGTDGTAFGIRFARRFKATSIPRKSSDS